MVLVMECYPVLFLKSREAEDKKCQSLFPTGYLGSLEG
jgi:hypothetical protein